MDKKEKPMSNMFEVYQMNLQEYGFTGIKNELHNRNRTSEIT